MIIKELALDDKIYRPAGVAARISSAKNNLITASVYASNEAIAERDRISKMPMMPEIYLKYASRCYKSGAMDFCDHVLQLQLFGVDGDSCLLSRKINAGFGNACEFFDGAFNIHRAIGAGHAVYRKGDFSFAHGVFALIPV